MGVFDIEDIGKGRKDDSVRAVVKDSLACTTCRECIRDEYFNERLELAKIKDRFEFHVESVGVYSPEQLVVEALACDENVGVLADRSHVRVQGRDTIWMHGVVTGAPGVGVE